MKKDIKPKALKRVAKAPAAGEVKKTVPMGQYEARVVQDIRSSAAEKDMKGRPMWPGGMAEYAKNYQEYYGQQLSKAKSLDNPDKLGGAAALKKKIQKDGYMYEPNLYDIPAKQLKGEAKGVAKKAAKQLKKSAK